MKTQENSGLIVLGFVAAFVIVMATPAFAEKVVSTTTTTVGAPTTTTKTSSSVNPDGSTTTKYTTTTTQPTRTVKYTINTSDEALLHKYLTTEFPSECGAGTVYYDGKCITDDVAATTVKRTYIIGQPLPTTVELLPLPDTVLTSMSPAPDGYYYSQLDRDVLLINRADGTVVDAVSYYSL